MDQDDINRIKDSVNEALVNACKDKAQRYLEAKAEYEGFRDAKSEAYAAAAKAIDDAIKCSSDKRNDKLAFAIRSALTEANAVYQKGATDSTQSIQSIVDAYDLLRKRLSNSVDSINGG